MLLYTLCMLCIVLHNVVEHARLLRMYTKLFWANLFIFGGWVMYELYYTDGTKKVRGLNINIRYEIEFKGLYAYKKI